MKKTFTISRFQKVERKINFCHGKNNKIWVGCGALKTN